MHIFPVLGDNALRSSNHSYIDRLGLLIVITKNSLCQNTRSIVTENGKDVHLSLKIPHSHFETPCYKIFIRESLQGPLMTAIQPTTERDHVMLNAIHNYFCINFVFFLWLTTKSDDEGSEWITGLLNQS